MGYESNFPDFLMVLMYGTELAMAWNIDHHEGSNIEIMKSSLFTLNNINMNPNVKVGEKLELVLCERYSTSACHI